MTQVAGFESIRSNHVVYKIVEVPRDLADLPEQLGTKPKFWFDHDGRSWLFKEARPNAGEDWSEKCAAELAHLVGLPHADYDLALSRNRRGVVTPNFVPEGGRLAHGNELLDRVSDDYPRSQFFRVSQHTLGLVIAVVGMDMVKYPQIGPAIDDVSDGLDAFVGYLMFDAWIANQDRHHENWALVRDPTGSIHLAPSYDHASSLGRNESDEKRMARLRSRDRQFDIAAYVRRARSAFYAVPGDTQAMPTLDVFARAASERPKAARAWLGRLDAIETASVAAVFDSVPSHLISDAAIEFARRMLDLNKERLLAVQEDLQ